MLIKAIFTKPSVTVPVNNQEEMNSFIHKCLGTNNKYHDAFSKYAISSLQGGKCKDGKTLSFEDNNPYIQFSSNDNGFIEAFMSGLQNGNHSIFGMTFKTFEFDTFTTNPYYDRVVTISPILLKDKNDMKITFENSEWINILNEQSKKKLSHEGINDPTFRIELRNPERGKKKLVWVGNVFNPASMIGLTVYGTKKSRETIYNLGFGNSTGSGFGSVKIYK